MMSLQALSTSRSSASARVNTEARIGQAQMVSSAAGTALLQTMMPDSTLYLAVHVIGCQNTDMLQRTALGFLAIREKGRYPHVDRNPIQENQRLVHAAAVVFPISSERAQKIQRCKRKLESSNAYTLWPLQQKGAMVHRICALEAVVLLKPVVGCERSIAKIYGCKAHSTKYTPIANRTFLLMYVCVCAMYVSEYVSK